MLKRKFKSKFKNVPVIIDGIWFASKKEGKRYTELKLLERTGIVSSFTRQKAFDLPGGTKYRCDFEVCWVDGRTTIEDVKGMRTAMYKLKKKQVEALYPIKIIEI